MIHLESVVFATDFSPASYNAGLYASAVSRHFHANLIVAHAFVLTQAALEVEAEKPLASQQRINLKHDLALVAEVLKSGKGEAETALIEGDPREVVPALARGDPRTLVVLGTHGRGSLDRFILGSTAEGILRRSPGPLLTVGPNVDILLHAGTLKVRRILFASDGSPEAGAAARVAVALAEDLSAELDVLRVRHAAHEVQAEQLQRIQAHFQDAVEATMPLRSVQTRKPRTFAGSGAPLADILSHIHQHEIDLLILGLPRSAVAGMQNQISEVFTIIVKATCPVLTITSKETS